MYTVEEIRNITFTKSLGGYKTSEVDDFIDGCADTVEALTAEAEDLKKKMEVLAAKVREYRDEEDSIRTALLSAQRLGDTVLREANHKASLILEDAQIKADKIEEVARQQIQEQMDELERMKQLVGEFKNRILNVYREHLAMIDVLPDYEQPEQEEEPVEEEAEAPVEEAVTEEMPVEEPAQEDTFAEETPAMPVSPDAVEETVVSLFTEDEQEEAATSQFGNLKFGTDYNIEDDDDDE